MIKLKKGLTVALVFSLGCHLFCFFGLEFSFSAARLNFQYPNVYFLGQLLDKSDFPFDSSLKLWHNQAGFFSRQNSRDEILYKSRVIDRRGFLITDNMIFEDAAKSIEEKVAVFLKQKKPLLYIQRQSYKDRLGFSYSFGYSARSIDADYLLDSEDKKQRLKIPFIYNQLSNVELETELELLSQGNIVSARRVSSSGNLEADLFAVKSMRRKIYLNNRNQDLFPRRIRVILSND